DVGGIEVDVVGDEELAGADHGGAGGGVKPAVRKREAEVGSAVRVDLDLFPHALELTLANVFQAAALGAACGRLIEVDGDLIATPDLGSGPLRQADTVLQRGTFEGDKGNYVGGAEAGMSALVAAQVNALGGEADGAHGGFRHRLRLAGNGDDGAIVVVIHLAVEQ